MLRTVSFAAALLITLTGAHAEIWMVKPSGGVGCRDRSLFSAVNASEVKLPTGCVRLYAGERLLESANSIQGFAEYLEVQRGDGSFIFVSRSLLAADPGIGSVEEDRQE